MGCKEWMYGDERKVQKLLKRSLILKAGWSSYVILAVDLPSSVISARCF